MGTKHIADPVHGAIDLHPWEFEVIDTPTFQRLRRIKQLAMASHVYPGADHSRFVHSLGVFAIMSRLVQRLRELHPCIVKEEDAKKLRLAALLHDVGHYPYSHLMEKLMLPAPSEPDASDAIEPKPGGTTANITPGQFLRHEALGEIIVTRRQDISSTLKAHGHDPAEIASIFCSRHGQPFYNQLLSKGLDTDRLDYMLRDAHYTGVPYGSVDIEYILRNVDIDQDKNVCITPKAILSTEHFLLSRWYNYGAVVFQRTVMAMEALVRCLLQRMVNRGALPSTAQTILGIVESEHEFLTFDDHYVDEKIRRLAVQVNPDADVGADAEATDRFLAYAVLNRVKPRCVFEAIQEPGNAGSSREIDLFDKQIPRRASAWAEDFHIPADFWFTADSTPRHLDEARRYGSFTDELDDRHAGDAKRVQEISRLVRVLEPGGSSQFLVDRPTSLLRPLTEATFRVARFYVLLPEEVKAVAMHPPEPAWRQQFKTRAREMREHIRKDLSLA